jgi:acyl carrier protein
VDWQKWHEAHPKLGADSRFRDLLQRSGSPGGNPAIDELRREMEGFSKEKRLAAMEHRLQGVLARTLKMSPDAISPDRKLNEMGVDSLMVLELGLGIKDELGISFSAMEFLKGPSLRHLAALAEQKVWKSPA